MKKVFSMICALALSMSAMLISPMAEAATFVDDNGPRIVTDCTKITTKGLATIDFYLDFEKYDFADEYVSSTYYDEEEEDDVNKWSGKGIQAIQVDVPVSQFVGDLVSSSSPITANTEAGFPNLNVAYNTADAKLVFLSYAGSMNDVYVPTEKVKLFTAKVYVDTALVDESKTGDLVDANLDIEVSESIVTIWTLEDQVQMTSFTEKSYALNEVEKIFGTPDKAIISIGDAVGTAATAGEVTGKVWNEVKVVEAGKSTNYTATFTNTATGETKPCAFSLGELTGDVTFGIILKLVDQAGNAANILLDIAAN